MTKPAWLKQLRPLERRQAERWLASVGETRFMVIAKAATSVKRPKNRPRSDNNAIIAHSLLFWLTHPQLKKSAVPAALAAEIKQEAPAGGRFSNMGVEAVKDLIRDSLKNPPIGLLAKAEAEAVRLGFPVRNDTGWAMAHQQEHLDQLISTYGRPPWINNAAIGSDVLAGRIRNAVAGAWRPAMSPNQIDRIQRLGHLLRALDGLVGADLPISQVTALFDDMVAILNEE